MNIYHTRKRHEKSSWAIWDQLALMSYEIKQNRVGKPQTSIHPDIQQGWNLGLSVPLHKAQTSHQRPSLLRGGREQWEQLKKETTGRLSWGTPLPSVPTKASPCFMLISVLLWQKLPYWETQRSFLSFCLGPCSLVSIETPFTEQTGGPCTQQYIRLTQRWLSHWWADQKMLQLAPATQLKLAWKIFF